MNFLPFATLLLPAIPIAIWVAWSDLRFMKIPNIASISLFLSFVVLGAMVFTFPEYGIRLLQGLVILVIGFILSSIRLVGAGDSKFAAAMAPFVALSDSTEFIILLSVTALVSVLLHRIVEWVGPLRRLVDGWGSWGDHRKFPFGLSLSGSLVIYLVLRSITPLAA